jgi:enhancer of mRNA-decapping protein 3
VEAVNENAAPPGNVKAPRATPVLQTKKAFEDPAILSVGKRPTSVPRAPLPGQWNSTMMERADSARTATGRENRALRDITPAATLVEPMQKISVVEDQPDLAGEGMILDELAEADVSPELQELPAPKAGRRTRRRKPRRTVEDSTQDPAVAPAKETTRSKGWRQTPLLEPNPSFQPFSTLKKKGRRNGKVEENGWATEDATDVQDMGDFDFAGNLSKFDKHTVFSQIQAEDSVADEDRLVAHNRLPKAKPGTAGGKNLHYTENVLEVPNGSNTKAKIDPWKSEEGDSDLEERATQRDSGSGRHSRRADSKLSTSRRPVSRKGSANIQPARTLSVSSPRLSSFQTLMLADSGALLETILLPCPIGSSLRTYFSSSNAEPRKYRRQRARSFGRYDD